MKVCNDCKVEKDDSEFNKNQKICKGCKSIRHKKYYPSQREKSNKRSRDRRLIAKTYLLNIKKDLECERCGEDHPATLDFHHPNPDEKEFSISNFVVNYSLTEKNKERLDLEIKKCEVLCANCHRKEHSKNIVL